MMSSSTPLCEHGHTDRFTSCNQCSAREIEGSSSAREAVETAQPVAWRYRYVYDGKPARWTLRSTPMPASDATPGFAAVEVEPLYNDAAIAAWSARIDTPPSSSTPEVVEAAAEHVYEAMRWAAAHAESGSSPPWVPNGNSDAQYEARKAARAIAALPPSNMIGEAIEALAKCEHKFRHYEDLHRLKCTAEGDEKADRNREMADMCSATLSKLRGEG